MKAASYLTSIRKKLTFLRGSYRLVLAWPVATIVLAYAGWYLVLSDLRDEKEARESQALREAEVLSKSYSAQLTRTVEAIDQIALQVRYHWDYSKGELQLNDAKAKAAFPPTSAFHIIILDKNGFVSTATMPVPERTFLGDREYFLLQKTAMDDSLYIGEPVSGRLLDKTTIPFSRKLLNQDGSFGGVVAVTVEPQHFTAGYNEKTFGKHGLLGIVGNDSIVRVTRTDDVVYPVVDERLVSTPHFPTLSKAALLDGNRWFSDKRSRYVSWESVDGYPLMAMAGLDQEEVLAPYWANRAAAIRDAILATAILVLFKFIGMGLSMRLAWRKYQMEQAQATYRMATEHGNEGFYIVQAIHGEGEIIADFKIIDCNHRGAELFQHRREELVGKTISALYERSEPDAVIRILSRAMSAGSYEAELEVPDDSPFTGQWAYVKIARADGTLAVTLRDISDTKAHVAELERQSNEDALTGLPNRQWVQANLPKAIEHAAAKDAMLAVLFIDLDGFKTVNDTMGHEAGDDVLRNAARRLKVAVRPHDYVARLGGDEFVVILEGIVQKADAAHVAQRIQHAFQDSFRLAKGVQSIGVSIGISVFPEDGADSETLLRHADIAMYSVKTSGKRNYRFFDQKFYDAMRARHDRETELRNAIENDQLVMYYQPRVDIATGTTSSMEALVRWAHPTKGLLKPLEFIPLAEETGLILRLGELVIEKVCAQLAYWKRKNRELVPVSINVSSRQFNETDVAKVLSTCLARYDVAPELIEIELTESSMMGDSVEVSHTLAAIQEMGVKLLVDDFGTGYSSLSQLQQLDFDVLKVDRAFTAELERTEEGNVFFKAIITMAHALGMRVVAEGVETLEQIKILKSLKCDEIQGFYISKPLPPSDSQPILPKWFVPSTT